MPSSIARDPNRPETPVSRRRLRLVLSAFYAAQFGHLGIVLPFLALWFRARGMGPASIGVLMALPALATMITPWTWGRWADRSGRRRALLISAAALAALFLAALVPAPGRGWIFALVAAYGFARSPLLPYAEATSLEQSELRGFDYGPIRLWGSLAFVAVSLGFGALLPDLGIDGGLLIGAGFLGAAALVATAFPAPLTSAGNDAATNHEPGPAGAPADRRASLLRFFVACALMQISHGAFYTFYSIRLQDLGYSDAVIGWQWALAVICEVLMLTRVDRAVRRLGSPAILRLCIAIAVLRWLLVASTESLSLLTLSQALHAFTYAAFHVAAIRIVHRSFAHARAKGQALYSGMTYGLGLFVGSTLAGILATPLGLPTVFLLSAAVAASALFVLGRPAIAGRDRD